MRTMPALFSVLLIGAIIADAQLQLHAAKPSILATFDLNNGSGPDASLILDSNGNLFGTTENGGPADAGTVFEIIKSVTGYAAKPTLLYSFCAQPGCVDGSHPVARLLIDGSGNLFGTTSEGGTYGFGTVFEIAKASGGYANAPVTLYSFCARTGCSDGAAPTAGVIADATRNLFGTTSAGGAHGVGTVFELPATPGGYAAAPTVLYNFCTQSACADGREPYGDLLIDGSGNLFGTTLFGGNGYNPSSGQFGYGTVFELAKTPTGHAGAVTTLYAFCPHSGCADGTNPFAGLFADPGGNLFGTTSAGGASNQGTVFEIAKSPGGYAGAPTILYSFCAKAGCTDGANPYARLIADASGDLFGTTSAGGAGNAGTVFELVKTKSGYATAPTVLYSFCPQSGCADGQFPFAGLTGDPGGNLFGTAFAGGNNNNGTVFEIAKPASGGGGSGPVFAGVPGSASCYLQSVSALLVQYHTLTAAAAALGFPSVTALQTAIQQYCAA